jgi:hypothetical protein
MAEKKCSCSHDCCPLSESETVVEIISGPDRHGKTGFFAHWIGKGHFSWHRGQINLVDLRQFRKDTEQKGKAIRLVDHRPNRPWPKRSNEELTKEFFGEKQDNGS